MESHGIGPCSDARLFCVVVAFFASLFVPLTALAQPASCTNFTDPTLSQNSTPVKAAHFNELRTCINDLRTSRGLSPASWTDSLVPGQASVKAVHLTEMRSALNAVYTTASLTPPDFGSAPIAGATLISVEDIVALRGAAVALPSCSSTVSPQLTNVSGTANDVVISVTTGAGCVWTPYEESEYASFESTAVVSGSGTATLQIVANDTVVSRTITAVVAGTYVNVIQARAPCIFQVSPTNSNVASGYSEITFAVTTNECSWTASEESSFASFTSESGGASGETVLQIAANPTLSARSVSATIAGISVNVTQSACTAQVTPTNSNIGSGATGVSFAIATNDCHWTATEQSDFADFSAGSGQGNGTTVLQVSANPTVQTRTVNALIAGVAVTVVQAPLAIQGCMDPDATNYNASATVDDGSCTYEEPTISLTLDTVDVSGSEAMGSEWLRVYGDHGMQCVGEMWSDRLFTVKVTIHGAEGGPIISQGSGVGYLRKVATMPSVWNESPGQFECVAEFTAVAYRNTRTQTMTASRFWGAYDRDAFGLADVVYEPDPACSHSGMFFNGVTMGQPAPGYAVENPPVYMQDGGMKSFSPLFTNHMHFFGPSNNPPICQGAQ